MDLNLTLLPDHAARVELEGVSLEDYPDSPRNQDILKLIDRALKKAGKSLDDITNINLDYQEGTFTSIKVAATLANTLAISRNITVNGQKPPHLPQYSREPNITYQKGKNK